MFLTFHILLPIFISYGSCMRYEPEFTPVYISLSPLHKDATHSTKLIEREVQIQWDEGAVDSIALYNNDPSNNSSPIFEFPTMMFPDGFVQTNISFGDPDFPGGWQKDSGQIPNQGDHCLPMWILAFKEKQLVFSDCIKIRPTWMQDNRLTLENLEITTMFLPGTHNSGSYRRTETSGQRDASGRYIITQDQDLWQQLVYGIRYLDFRIGFYCHKKNGSEAVEDESCFWINHDLIKIRKFAPVLEDLKNFLKKTKEEVIIIDLHRFPVGFVGRPNRHHLLVKILDKELKEYVLPYKKGSMPTFGSVLQDGKRVIISYGDNTIAKEYDWLWPPIRQLWGNRQTVDQLYDFLDKCMLNDSLRETSRGPWAAMAQLTPGPLDLLFNPKGSLRQMAAQVNRNLTEWCRYNWWDKANIVATDFFLSTDLINTAVTTNVFKGSTAKHYVTN